ncbi:MULTISPECIES: hypothetical protein [unclassified Leclercia]|uniref:Uncharacterized protein n=1 Tax=Leclercia barmai TaxID=2785629 RepID=A0ABS7RT18_9ENTR|nr:MULTISPECIES: hypothetical protein [unclassified Leclercia]MBZ0057466.1 hypothetical protein [Leclercia sp. EMC7]MCM5695630.1 hypothetical protein [Leclercia sp. LTM01]MCM5700038.1 hypothetical protein [Leclercia sp. LTM14]
MTTSTTIINSVCDFLQAKAKEHQTEKAFKAWLKSDTEMQRLHIPTKWAVAIAFDRESEQHQKDQDAKAKREAAKAEKEAAAAIAEPAPATEQPSVDDAEIASLKKENAELRESLTRTETLLAEERARADLITSTAKPVLTYKERKGQREAKLKQIREAIRANTYQFSDKRFWANELEVVKMQRDQIGWSVEYAALLYGFDMTTEITPRMIADREKELFREVPGQWGSERYDTAIHGIKTGRRKLRDHLDDQKDARKKAREEARMQKAA